MKKVLCIIALAAVSFGSVYAGNVNHKVAVADTTMKIKKKGTVKKKKMKVKKDTTATKM